MSQAARDPYEVLGVPPEVSDEDLRRVYRALVKRHHPDHNGGSPESAALFAEIQDAYARLMTARHANAAAPPETPASAEPAAEDPDIEARIAELERELAVIRERERRAALASREAARLAAYQQPAKPTREQLGYYETDDSLSKILDDAGAELGERLKGARRSEFTRRLTDLFGGGE